MYETKSKPLKCAAVIAFCFIVAIIILSGVIFTPVQEESVEEVPQTPVQVIHTACPPSVKSEPTLHVPDVEPASELTIEEPEEEPEIEPNPYAEMVLTEAEKELLARMAYSEANDQEFEGQIAVVQVALNRVLHDDFPNNIIDVLFSPNQFCVGNYYDEQQTRAVDAALAGDPVLDLNIDVVFFSTGKLKYGSYYKTIGDHVFRTYF